MKSEHWTDRLSEYVDGELPEGEREALELHLLECPACTELVAEVRQIVATAGALEDREPGDDLWQGIAGRLAPRAAASAVGAGPAADSLSLEARRAARDARRLAFTVPQLLAAGIALVLFSAGGAWIAASAGATGAVGATPGSAVAATPAEAAEAPAQAGATFAAAYEDAIAELETAYQQRRPRLEPETIQVVERNLAIIDAAIADARRALEQDPASGFLNNHLASAMRRKVDLLRQAARIDRTQT